MQLHWGWYSNQHVSFVQTHAKTKSERDAFEQQLANHTSAEADWQAKHDKLSADLETGKSALAAATGEREKVLLEHSTLKSKHSTSQQLLSHLQAQSSQTSSQLSVSSRQLSSTQAELTSVNKRLDQADETVKRLQKENMDLLNGLNEMRPKIVELNEDKVELGERIESLQSELRTRDGIIGALETDLAQTSARVAELEDNDGDRNKLHTQQLERLERMTTEHQQAYHSLEAELSESQAVVRDLTTERTSARQAANHLQAELDSLGAQHRETRQEMQVLRGELDERAKSGEEVSEMLGRLREEVESLRTELSLKEEELIRAKAQLEEANLRASAPSSATMEKAPSWNEELLEAAKQQNALELSEAQSQIRTLETSVFQEQAKTHTLQRRVTALEDEVHMLTMQLASSSAAAATPQRLLSPGMLRPGSALSPTTNGARSSADLKRPSPTSRTPSARQQAQSIVPPHPAIDAALSPEARHKRKVSLSMLKARIDSEMSMRRVPLAAAPNGSHHHTPKMGRLSELDEREEETGASSSSGAARRGMAMLSRPQFGDESHVFCCASCTGDLVVL